MTPTTTKGRPAATGRPLKTQSRGNGSQIDAPTKGHNMNIDQRTAITTDDQLDSLAAPVTVQDASGEVWHRARQNDLWACSHGDEHPTWLVLVDADQPLRVVTVGVGG